MEQRTTDKPIYTELHYEQIKGIIESELAKATILKTPFIAAIVKQFNVITMLLKYLPDIIIILSNEEKGRIILEEVGFYQYLKDVK